MCSNGTHLTLFCLARVVDRQVRLKTDLWDPSCEGGCVRFAHHLHPGETARGSGRRYRTIPFSYRDGCCNGAHRYNQDLAKADTSPGAGDGCSGPAIREIEMKWGRYYTLLRITTYLPIARIMKEVLSFQLCKWDYISRTFFPNWLMKQILRGNILVKRTGRCSC